MEPLSFEKRIEPLIHMGISTFTTIILSLLLNLASSYLLFVIRRDSLYDKIHKYTAVIVLWHTPCINET